MNINDIDMANLSNDPEELKKIIFGFKNEYENLNKKNKDLKYEHESLKFDIFKLKETIKIYQFKLFGNKSENLPKEEQPGLFNESEIEEKEIRNKAPEEKIRISYERIKKSGKRKLPTDLPRVEKTIDLKDEEKKCSCCGQELTKIGEEVSEKLEIIPQQVFVTKIIRPKYSCKACKNNDPKVKTAVHHQLIPYGIATASIAAFVFKSKFVDALPYYRQEKIYSSLGIDLDRKTMCNWQIYIYYNYLVRLIDLMKADLKKSFLIQADETTVQVVHEEGKPPCSKSYMWVYRGYHDDRVILLYDYCPNRKSENPKEYLKDFEGYLQTDGYDGYNLTVKENKIIHLACWAHARRKFFNCFKIFKESEYPESKIILDYIQSLYTIEKNIREKGLSDEKIYQTRQKESKPVIEKIRKWLLDNVEKYPPESGMGEAINYTLKLWDNLIIYLSDGRLLIDNNPVENSIRPFVIGRKNWLFSQTADGANSSASLYSLIETAKANGKEPYDYLKNLFEKLPEAKSDDDYRKLLPCYDSNLFDGVN